MESTTTLELAVTIKPLKTSQDWAQWAKGVRIKLGYYNLYKYIQSDIKKPAENETEILGYSKADRWEADQAKAKSILRVLYAPTTQDKVDEFDPTDEKSVFEVYEFLKKTYSKQNAWSLGTLFKTIVTAKLKDFTSIEEYGTAISKAGKRLTGLGHPVESWILAFFFLDGLGPNHEAFRQAQNTRYAELTVNHPTTKYSKDKITIIEDTSGYMKIEDMVRTLVQDEANQKGASADLAMRAGPPRGRGFGREKGSSRGRGDRGRGSLSFRGRAGFTGNNSGGDDLECETCLAPGHSKETCFFGHPEIAPESFKKRYPDKNSKRAGLLLRRAENKGRKNNENQKKQGGNEGGNHFSAFVSNACLPIINNAICLPNDSCLKNTTLSAAQLRATTWYIDSCSSLTLGYNIHDFEDLEYGSQRSFLTANGTWVNTTAKGTVHITSVGANNASTSLIIRNAYYCPEVSANLISLGQLARNDCMSTQIGLDMTVYDPAFNPVLYSRCEDNVFVVNSPGFVAAANTRGASLSIWHQRLGHTNYKYTEKISDRIDIVGKDKAFLRAMYQRKTTSRSFKTASNAQISNAWRTVACRPS